MVYDNRYGPTAPKNKGRRGRSNFDPMRQREGQGMLEIKVFPQVQPRWGQLLVFYLLFTRSRPMRPIL